MPHASPAACQDGAAVAAIAHALLCGIARSRTILLAQDTPPSSPPQQLPDYTIRAPRRIKYDAPKGGTAAEVEDGQPNSRRQGRGRRSGGSSGRVELRRQGKAKEDRNLQRLYVTGGSARGRRIVTPSVYLRPMMSRVREALYSMLTPTGILRASASHLDLYAGAGTVGLESLSRGVGAATFVDFSPVAAKTIRQNADSVGLGERATIVEARVDSVLQTPAAFGLKTPFDIVSITPPYEEVVYSELMAMVAASPVVGEDSLVIVEYPIELGCFPPTLSDGALVGLRNRRYGRTVLAVYVYRPSGRLDLNPFSEEFVSL